MGFFPLCTRRTLQAEELLTQDAQTSFFFDFCASNASISAAAQWSVTSFTKPGGRHIVDGR
jgi:hypothetical protein